MPYKTSPDNSNYNYRITPGLMSVGSYQVSGRPWVSASINATTATRVKFPNVTKWFAVQNNQESDMVKLAFSELGVENNNWIYIPSNDPAGAESGDVWGVKFDLKVTEIWLSGSDDCAVIAGLTGIHANQIDNPAVSPSGTNWSGSTGIG